MGNKILFVHNIVAPYRMPLFDSLAKEYDLNVLFLKKNDKERLWSQVVNEVGYDYHFLDSRTIKIFGKKISVTKGLAGYINNSSAELVVLLDDPENIITFFMAMLYCKFKRKKVILLSPRYSSYISVHDSFASKIMKKAVDIFRVPMYFLADFIWCYSKETVKQLGFFVNKKKLLDGAQGYPSEMVLNGNNIDVDISAKYHSNEILYLGYLNKRKGLDVLLAAFDKLYLKNSNLKLRIIGDGELKDYIESKKQSYLVYEGYKEGEEKFKLIQSAKFLCLPSHSDSWGWVVHEAQSCLTPVITTKQVVASESMPDDTYTYNSSSVEELYELLLAASSIEYEDYLSLAQESYESSKKHTLSKAITSFKQAVGNVL